MSGADDGYEHARQRWPEVDVAAADFARYLAARAAASHLDDLYLACGCALGQARAIAAFDRAVRGDIELALARLGLDAGERDEVAQQTRVRLFVGPAPKITEYTGRGSLAGWVRVVALRLGLNFLRSRRRFAEPPDVLAAVQSAFPGADGERVVATLQGELAQALQVAFASLSTRHRNVLRQHFLDGASFKDLAAAYGVHRVTASIWLKEAREALLVAAEQRLRPRVGESLSAILDMLGSRLDLDLHEVLRTRPAA